LERWIKDGREERITSIEEEIVENFSRQLERSGILR
jgi:hypothetical protein